MYDLRPVWTLRFVLSSSSGQEGEEAEEPADRSWAEERRLVGSLQPGDGSTGRELQEAPEATLQQVSDAQAL